jgi:hypothetical protein
LLRRVSWHAPIRRTTSNLVPERPAPHCCVRRDVCVRRLQLRLKLAAASRRATKWGSPRKLSPWNEAVNHVPGTHPRGGRTLEFVPAVRTAGERVAGRWGASGPVVMALHDARNVRSHTSAGAEACAGLCEYPAGSDVVGLTPREAAHERMPGSLKTPRHPRLSVEAGSTGGPAATSSRSGQRRTARRRLPPRGRSG